MRWECRCVERLGRTGKPLLWRHGGGHTCNLQSHKEKAVFYLQHVSSKHSPQGPNSALFNSRLPRE